jgi:hypothetical protein
MVEDDEKRFLVTVIKVNHFSPFLYKKFSFVGITWFM